MKCLHRLPLIVASLLALLLLPAVGAAAQPAAQKPANPAYAQIEDDPKLPRVLLIGDSISIGYTLDVRENLAGKANVHRPPTNCGPTTTGLDQLDDWLGDGKWDVIHFNWGLHDLKQIEGERQVPLDDYRQNLQSLVARLKKTGAKLIWCSTTPVPEGTSPPRTNADVIAYNEAAAGIMKENGVAVDDLYSFAQPRLEKIQRPKNVHFTPEGSAVLAEAVAKAIEQALGR